MDFIGFCCQKLERRKVKGFGNCWLLHRERVRICNNHVMLQVWLLENPEVMHWMPWMLADFCGLQVDWKHGLFCSGRTASRPDMRLLNGWQYPLANLSKLVFIHVYTYIIYIIYIYIYIYIYTHECIYIIYISFYCYLLRHPLANDIQCFEPRVSLSTLDPPHMDGSNTA